MPRNQLIGYNGKFWRLIDAFSYTGADQPFTLSSGKYLFVCKGGKSTYHDDATNVDLTNYGGTSYGIINLTEQTTFHAVVGGNVNSSIEGGFNGGANGNLPYSTYVTGIGGAGASDIRLLEYDPNEYPTYDSSNNMIEPNLDKTYYYDSSYDASSQTADQHKYLAVEYIKAYKDSGYIDTGFYDSNLSRIQIDVIFEKQNNRNTIAPFACWNGSNLKDGGLTLYTRYNSTNNEVKFARGDGTNEQSVNIDLKFGERVLVDITHHKVSVNIGGKEISSYDIGDANTEWVESQTSVYVNAIHKAGYSADTNCTAVITLYGFKGYNNNVLESDLVPVKRVSDNKCGLFNTVDNTFHEPNTESNNKYWLAGPTKFTTPSLNSRLIVAGGAGGVYYGTLYPYYTDYYFYNGKYGFGGLNGGPVYWVSSNVNLNYMAYASQTKGHAFGYGGQPNQFTSGFVGSQSGSGGGGGGWYGGFSSYSKNVSTNYLSTNGGGGSSYVLTSSSYKPSGYNPNSKYYMTNPLMTPSDALEPGVYVYKETSLESGDVVEFPCIGDGEHIILPPGEYKFQCYGGNGGSTYRWIESSKGGYSEGIFKTDNPRNVYVYVGGSGGPSHILYNFDLSVNETLTNATLFTNAFNGGGKVDLSAAQRVSNGGGGTDIRIDEDSLYNRIIVAGGGGSQGSGMDNNSATPRYSGGVGGGETGEKPTDGNGTNYGGGGQTGTPATDGSHPETQGTFGIGGLCYNRSTRYPGVGGGGWFGGNGSIATSNNATPLGGAGGSGFVLTSSTELISGYNLTHDDDLTNAYTLAGGNNLGPNMSKAVITCNNIYAKIICEDDEGFKYYNNSNNTWTFLPSQRLTPEVFEEYGSLLTTDTGLVGDTYKVYLYDESESASKLVLDIVPPRQIVDIDTQLSLNISNYNLDEQPYDPLKYNVKCQSVKVPDVETGELITHIKLIIDKLAITDNAYKAYGAYLIYNESDQPHEYLKLDEDGKHRLFKHYITNDDSGEIIVEERTMELGNPEDYRDPVTGMITTHQSLLPVGSNSKIPLKYFNIADQDTTNVFSCMITNYGPIVYVLYVIDTAVQTKILLIKSLNLRTETIDSILRTPLTSFYYNPNVTPINGFLADSEYFYLSTNLSQGTIDDRRSLTKINIISGTISRTARSDYDIYIYYGGQIQWLDNTHIILLSSANDHCVMIYDTENDLWTHKNLSDNNTSENPYRFAIGSRYFIITTSTNPSVIKVYDIDTFTLVTKITTSTSSNYYFPCITYNSGKFYIVNYTSFIDVLDEETLTLNRLANISPITGATFVRYVNGALYITQEGTTNNTSNKIIIYRIPENVHSIIYTPWTSLNSTATGGGTGYWFEPHEMNGTFFYGINTVIASDYTGYSKYKFGKKFNQNYMSFTTENIDNITYDDRFITVDSIGTYIHDGDIEYQFSEYDTNHITYCEVNKSDYGIIKNSSISSEDPS